jgi:capsular exopolysaccharide synthesis family protein
MELRGYLGILRRRKWLVLGVLAAAIATAFAATHFMQRKYTATATIHVGTGVTIVDRSVRADDVVYLDRLENTYARLAASFPVIDRVVREFSLPARPRVAVRAIPNTELMKISVTTTRPPVAAKAADRVAALLIQRIRTINAQQVRRTDADFRRRIDTLSKKIALERQEYDRLATRNQLSPRESLRLAELKQDIALDTASVAAQQQDYAQYRVAQDQRANSVSVVESALVPGAPSSPNVKLNLVLAALLGLAAGIGIAFVAENLSTRVETSEDITDAVDLSIVGVIPKVKGTQREPILNGGSVGEEAFRRLTSGLIALQGRDPAKTILLTSAQPGEGKSLTTVNLARTLAERDSTVVVVDADLRLPTLHRMLNVDNEMGLASVLTGELSLAHVVKPTALVPGRLFVVPSGRPKLSDRRQNPGALLARARFASILAELAKRFDYVLVDSPALLAVADALTIVPAVDGVLLVVAENQISRDDLQAAHGQLVAANAPLLGIVVNRADELQKYSRHYLRYLAAASERKDAAIL